MYESSKEEKMKFVKISALMVLVVIVVVFVLYKPSESTEEASIQQTLPPLTPVEKQFARHDVEDKIRRTYEKIEGLFNDDGVQNRWRKIKKAYHKIERTGGVVKITRLNDAGNPTGEPIVGAELITEHWKSVWGVNVTMTIDLNPVEHQDLGNIDQHIPANEVDMIAREITLIKIITSESNDDYRGEGEWRHKRSCEWIE
jgi:hypothetical protein